MLELTKGGRCMGGLEALRFFETLPDMIPDEVKTETFCDEYEYALNRVRVGVSWEIPVAPGKGKGHQVLYYCGQCGHGVRAEHKYCPKCGRTIDWWSLYGEKLVPYDSPLERLMELAQAEKAGRLVVLPLEAKEGDPIPQCFYGDGGLCPGMSAPNDDEPIEMCKRCWYCSCGYRQEAEEALRKENDNVDTE